VGCVCVCVGGVLCGCVCSTHSCVTDPKVQSEPEDGPHIVPKHVFVLFLL